MLIIDENKCTGCQKCIKVCPSEGALVIKGKVVEVDLNRCTLCSACVSICPVDAMQIKRKAKTADTSAYADVWVFAELDGEKLKPVVAELLGKGRELAENLKQNLAAVVLGRSLEIDKCLDKLAAQGADKIYTVADEIFADYSTDAYTYALSSLINRHKPEILLFGATHLGRDLAPAVAANLGLGLTADCTGLSINEEGLLLQTRPAFGGNVMADIICPNTRPQMATVRPNVMEALAPEPERTAEIISEKVKIEEDIVRTEILESFFSDDGHEIGIEEAEIIITGGRGLASKDDFSLLEELADALGGIVGCSRPIVEKGWMPKSRQVGQSGKTVSPKLYITCGVSGAIQHKVGIRNSDIIIAINKDENAPIFELADLAVVGDLYEIVPELIKVIKSKT